MTPLLLPESLTLAMYASYVTDELHRLLRSWSAWYSDIGQIETWDHHEHTVAWHDRTSRLVITHGDAVLLDETGPDPRDLPTRLAGLPGVLTLVRS